MLVALQIATKVSEDLAEGIFRITCLPNNKMSSQGANLMYISQVSCFFFQLWEIQ